MQVFLAVHSRTGPVPPEISERILELQTTFLPFSPHHVRERSMWEGRNCLLTSWSNGPPSFSAAIAASHRGDALVHTGYVLDPGHLRPEMILHRVTETTPDRAVARFAGVYSICLADADGTLRVWNSPGRLEPTFWASRGDLTFVSNRPLVVHLVATGSSKPAYSERFAADFLATGMPAGTGTPFEGVSIVEHGQMLAATSAGVAMVPDPITTTEAAAIDDIAAALVASAAAVEGQELRQAITGGKDSRLVAAVLRAAGLDFASYTTGLAEHPDVIVGRLVAEHLGVPHRHIEPSAKPDTISAEVLRWSLVQLRASDGLHSAYERTASRINRAASPVIILGGGGGEILRGGLAGEHHFGNERGVVKALERQFVRAPDYIHPDIRARRIAERDAWLAERPKDADPADHLAEYHLQYRIGRWANSGRLGMSVAQPNVSLFFDANVIRKTWALPLADRVTENVIFDLLGVFSPGLQSVPLGNARWAFEKDGPRPGDEEGYAARTPVAGGTRGSFKWRNALSTDVGRFLTDTILGSEHADALLDLTNRQAIRDVLAELPTGRHDDSPDLSFFLWALFTLSLLWSDDWLTGPYPDHHLTIPVPT